MANGLKQISAQYGANSIGALVSPHSTVEELHLASSLVRGLGSDNVDFRLRHAEFGPSEGVRWLGTSIASLSDLQQVLVVGSNLRKDHPLFAQRVRQAVRKGAQVRAITSQVEDWAMPVAQFNVAPSSQWTSQLASIAAAVANIKGVTAPVVAAVTPQAEEAAQALLAGERKAVLLGNAAAHHANAASLLALANWIAQQVGATVGYLTEAANTVGAQLVGAQPQKNGLNAAQMLAGGLKAAFLLNVEPQADTSAAHAAVSGLQQAQMVVTLSPFKTNLAFSDVLLPIAPFTETSGSFVNAEGRLQSFHAVVKPLGDTRPAWKVLRVLGNLMGLNGFDFESSQEVLAKAALNVDSDGLVNKSRLSNATQASVRLSSDGEPAPVVARIYELDALVRRAPSLQLTADARATREEVSA